MNIGTTERTRDERERTYERVLSIIEHNTVFQQPAFIPRYRIGLIAGYGSVDTDRLGSVLQAAVRNRHLLRVRHGGEELYAYARESVYLSTVIETVVEWDPTPKDIVAWCHDRIDELETNT